MTHEEFVDMCILCGCDYCPTIPKVGSVRAFKNITDHKTIENYIESDKSPEISEEFKMKYPLARKLFNIFRDKIDIENLPIYCSKYNSEDLYKYLVHDCSMSEKRVLNSFKKINYK